MKIRVLPLTFAALIIAMGASLAFPQTPANQQSGAQAQSPVRPGPAPTLTEVERLKIENLTLKAQALEQQLQQLNQQYGALVSQFNAEHPGYSFNAQNNSFTALPPAPAKTEPKK